MDLGVGDQEEARNRKCTEMSWFQRQTFQPREFVFHWGSLMTDVTYMPHYESKIVLKQDTENNQRPTTM